MTTARDIIKSALRKIAVLGTGSSLDATEANDALGTLNSMLASWSVEGNMVYAETKETFPLTSAASYTMGSGGDFNTTRPNKIVTAYTTLGATDYPLTMYDDASYASIADKTTAQGIPQILYNDGNFPLITIRLWPIPSGTTSITIYSEKPLMAFDTLDTAYAMPAEYQMALEFNLAMLLAPEYEREASSTVARTAIKSKRSVSVQNNKNNIRRSVIDAPLSENGNRRFFDIYREC
jgi:hypothetical protein